MTDFGENDDSASADPPEPLVKWERVCALIIGGTCGGAGGYAAFEKSNQAGTAMLLILAAIFLLIGVQGTPLIRFGSNSGSVELERRRKRKVEQALEQASEENNAEKAEGIVEGVKLVAPELVPRSYDSYRQYEDMVASAIIGMGYDVTRGPIFSGYRTDLEIKKNGRKAYVEMKLYSRPIQVNVFHQVIGIAAMLSAPVLLVASTSPTEPAKDLAGKNNVDFVQWRSEADNPALHAALERLFAE